MTRSLIFGHKVQLADSEHPLAGLELEPDSWTITELVLEGGVFIKERRKVPVAEVETRDGGLHVDTTWRELHPLGPHRPWQPELTPATRVDFVDDAVLHREKAKLLGVLADDDWQVQQFVVEYRHRKVLLPVGAALPHAEEWLYVQKSRANPDQLETWAG